MRKIFLVFITVLFAYNAYADNRLKPYQAIGEFDEVSGSSVTSSDFYLGFDTSANKWIKSDPTDVNIDSGTIDGVIIGGSSAAAITGTTFTGTALVLDGTTINEDAIKNPGRDWFNICGEATTINNNTVYYGPSTTLLASSGNGQTCDINAAGNTTEATADAPIYTNQAVQVLGMTCRNEADANANISFTLRTAAGATVPSVTCTIADGERDCVADVQTTTAIAAGATVAVAAASTGDIADGNGFVCNVSVAY